MIAVWSMLQSLQLMSLVECLLINSAVKMELKYSGALSTRIDQTATSSFETESTNQNPPTRFLLTTTYNYVRLGPNRSIVSMQNNRDRCSADGVSTWRSEWKRRSAVSQQRQLLVSSVSVYISVHSSILHSCFSVKVSLHDERG